MALSIAHVNYPFLQDVILQASMVRSIKITHSDFRLTAESGRLDLGVRTHVVDHNLRDIDVGDFLISFLEHLLTHLGIPTSNIDDSIFLIHIGFYDTLQGRIGLKPFERVRVTKNRHIKSKFESFYCLYRWSQNFGRP